MTTPRDCTDNYLEYYDRTTRPADRQRVYCATKLDGGGADRRTASNVAYLRLFAADVHRLPRFRVVYTPFLIGENQNRWLSQIGPDYGIGIVGKCLEPTTSKRPTKDGYVRQSLLFYAL